jgi:hypothetical protein
MFLLRNVVELDYIEYVRNKNNIPRTCEMQNGEEHTKEKFTRHKIYVVHHLGYVHRVAAIFHYKIGRLQRWHENTLTNPNPKYTQ